MENTTTEYPSQTLMFDSVCISPDKQIALHFQNNWELSCIITGEGTRLIANTYEPFSAGDVVLIPPGVPHCWYFNKEKTDKNNNIENITITFNTDFLTNIQQCFPDLTDALKYIALLNNTVILSGQTREKVYSVMLNMRTETKEKRILSFLSILLTLAEDKSGKVIISSKQLNRNEIRLSQIQSYVNCNYSNTITIDEIARHLSMNRSSFCLFFKRETGQTFIEYLNHFRLSLACELLKNGDKPIGEIAASVGFFDIPYFCRIFKKNYKITPTKYRSQFKLSSKI